MTQRIAGIAFLKVDGQQLPLRGNFTVSPSKVERGMIVGQDGPHGYSEMPRIQFIEGDVSLVPPLTIAALEAMVNVTVTAELANGITYVGSEMVNTAAFALNTREGMTHIRFEAGNTIDEF